MLWAHPEAIKYSTTNHQHVSGAPTRHQRARHLNFVTANTTKTIHTNVKKMLTFMAPSMELGGVTNSTAIPRTEMTSDAMNNERKLLLIAPSVEGIAFMW